MAIAAIFIKLADIRVVGLFDNISLKSKLPYINNVATTKALTNR
ncbi:MAG TPA: hypothetical protein VEG39_18350 [Clostridia bacterium]|nr:hypothetical protein [Clostridia bacterium]